MSLQGFFQNAYVTRDLDRAIDLCGPAMGIADFTGLDYELQLETPAGEKTIQLRVATGWVGGMQVELIQPVSGYTDPYIGGLPANADDFVPRLHHVAVRRDDPEALEREVAEMGLPIIFRTGGNGISSVFVDATSTVGHPVEFVCATPEGLALLGWPDTRGRKDPEVGPGGYDVATRHAQVFGKGPRIEAIPNAEIDAASWKLVNTIRESAGAGKTDNMPGFMRLMAKHPEIFRRQMEMGTTLFQGLIPARDREIAVLRISWLAGAGFEWGEHVEIAKRSGLSADEIERVTRGSSAMGWSEHDAAIVKAVEELFADFAISDATWAILARSWSEPQLIEFPMMAGQYLTTAFLLNSLRVPLGEGNLGLAHR